MEYSTWPRVKKKWQNDPWYAILFSFKWQKRYSQAWNRSYSNFLILYHIDSPNLLLPVALWQFDRKGRIDHHSLPSIPGFRKGIESRCPVHAKVHKKVRSKTKIMARIQAAWSSAQMRAKVKINILKAKSHFKSSSVQLQVRPFQETSKINRLEFLSESHARSTCYHGHKYHPYLVDSWNDRSWAWSATSLLEYQILPLLAIELYFKIQQASWIRAYVICYTIVRIGRLGSEKREILAMPLLFNRSYFITKCIPEVKWGSQTIKDTKSALSYGVDLW